MDFFTKQLAELLKLDPQTAMQLSELLEDRMREIAEARVELHREQYEHTYYRSSW